jgi:hypothetical protein
MYMLKCKLGISIDAKSRGYIMVALYNRRTKSGACNLVAKAIKAIASSKKAKYIYNNWLKSLLLWANYLREHSALLL